MPTPLRRRVRLARRGAGYTVAVLLVLVAVVVGIANQLLPLAERHPDKIATWLSERAGRRVVFDHVQTQWTRRGPLLRLDGLEIGDPGNPVVIGEAEMLVSMYAGLLPGRSFSELRLRGLDLTLERADDGRWQVRGLPGQQQAGGDPLSVLEGLGELQVIDGRLAVIAPSLGIDARLPRVDLRLRVDGDRVRAGLRAWMQAGVSPLDAALDFDRRRGDGRAYVGARKADLGAWSALLRLAGVAVTGGRGNAQAWAELRGHRVAVVTLDTALDDVRLRGAPLPDANGAASISNLRFDHVQARLRWRAASDGWRLDAPRLRIGSGKQLRTLDGLVLAGGQRYALLAEHIDAGPLFAVAALSDRLEPALRRWLLAATPALELKQIEVAGVRGGRMRAQGRIERVAFAPVGHAPGLRGLGGTLQGDEAGFAFRFDPRTPLTFDWPSGFGVSHVVNLHGGVSGWRDGDGWRIASSGLRIDGKGYGADVRGGLWFQRDGTRPRIDIAARLDETSVATAKGFWIRHKMPAATIRWLDDALLHGRVRDGRALIAGDLDDWPFADRNGRFEATATISGATVKFQPDWPALTHVDGDVAFVADGFTVGGKGTLAGIGIRRFEAGIPHFRQAELKVQAEGGGDASRLLALLRQSPLREQHAETLAALSAAGPAQVTFDLDLPFHDAKAMQLGGNVALGGAKLADSRWTLAFDDVRDKAAYDNHGFKADALRVMHDGQPGQLALRAGEGHVRDSLHAFEAELEAVLDADALLDRAPQLAWLKTHVQGRSPWTIAVAIPATGKAQAAPGSRLQLRSSLVGTGLDLPAPLRKPAAAALATHVDASLPLDSGDITVAFGDRMALRARSADGQTGIRVQLGSDRVAQPAPASGLVATGHATTLDAIDWITLTRADGNDDSNGNDLPLRSIDVSAGQLQLLGGSFSDARVHAVPTANGIAVRLEGDALAGTLLLPHARTAAVAGRLQRLHWRTVKPAARTEPTSDAPATAADASLDPSRIPPLNLVVDDFRVGDAQLGSASLRTQPMAGGMHIEQLQTRAPRQRIDASGDWLGRGASARTRLQLDLDSDDLGTLLAGFGFGGRIAGGDGQVHFNAAWPGSPGAFKPGTIDGTLTLAVHDGRLVEVEPGAGRVLGLLSLTELPRRLTLDFGDFFSEGFSFNRMGGAVRVMRGIARSDDLVIEGPAAEIRITGSADLRAQTYDQTIEVLPRTGNLLTVAGAIAGGPVGAAIGAAANLVLKKPLGQMAAKTYRVTGPWKDPDVQVIGRQQGRASTVQPAQVDPGDPARM